jgi:hypothetical protein
MDTVFLFLSKPIWYLLAFALGSRYFAVYAPHWRLRPWAIVVLATLARYGLGFPTGMLALSLNHQPVLFYGVLLGGGFALWWLVARVAFRRAPPGALVGFAVLGEIISAGIDLLGWREISNIHMC